MKTDIDKLRDALESAQNGLKWYREAYPAADSQADDEMETKLNQVLASLSDIETSMARQEALTDTRRRAAHQFDKHRMQALAHLQMMLKNPFEHCRVVQDFLKAGPATAEVKREDRYLVFKYKDVEAALTEDQHQTLHYLSALVDAHRRRQDKDVLQALVVEKDWPEFEATWALIAARIATTEKATPREVGSE